MCTFTYACAGVCLYVYDTITFVTHTHTYTEADLVTAHTHSEKKQNICNELIKSY